MKFEQDHDGIPSWSCSKAVYKPVWHIPLLSLQWINSWWWTEELSETCRVSCQNKFVKLVHLVGFIIKKHFPLVKYRISSWTQVFNKFTIDICNLLPSSNVMDFPFSAIDYCGVHELYRVSQEEWTKLRESVPYVELYRYNPKHLYPKLNGYGDNGQRSLKLWQLLHTYWLPNTD